MYYYGVHSLHHGKSFLSSSTIQTIQINSTIQINLTVLADTSKFEKITRNQILSLKTTFNKYIVNKNQQNKTLQPIIGEFSPGYIYGTVKIHKPDNPIRSIISQIPTPVYTLSKQLNTFITEYQPSNYIINSTKNSYK